MFVCSCNTGYLKYKPINKTEIEPKKSQQTMNDTSINFLNKIRNGDFSDWNNRMADCTRLHSEESFGFTGSVPDATGLIGNAVLTYRAYPPSEFATYGIVVWFKENSIELIQINSPSIKIDSILQHIGAPEITLPSLLLTHHDQKSYPSLGIVFHVSRITSEVFRIYVFRPCSNQQFLEAPLSKVQQFRSKRN